MRRIALAIAVVVVSVLTVLPGRADATASAQAPVFAGTVPGEWASTGYDAGRTFDNSDERKIGPINVRQLKVAWQASVTYTVYDQVAVAEGIVVMPMNNTKLVAMRVSDGTRLWTYTAPADANFQNEVLISGGIIYAPLTLFSGPGLVALDAETGKPRWQATFTPGANMRGAPAIGEGRIYVVTDGGAAFSLNAKTGKPIWARKYLQRLTPRGGFSFYKGRLYAAGSYHDAVVYSPETGGFRWATDGSGMQPIVVRDDRIYTSSQYTEAFPSRCPSGRCKPVWQVQKTGSMAVTRRLIAQSVGVGGDSWDQYLRELTTATGRQLWRSEVLPFQQPQVAIAGRVIYVTSRDSNYIQAYPLYGCGQAVCRPLWSRRLGPPDVTTVSAPVISNGTVYAANTDASTGQGTGVWAFRP